MSDIVAIGDGFKLCLHGPGSNSVQLDRTEHLLDIYLGGAASRYDLQTHADPTDCHASSANHRNATTNRSGCRKDTGQESALPQPTLCPPNSVRFLPGGLVRRLDTIRTGTTLRLLMNAARFDTFDCPAARARMNADPHIFDPGLIGAGIVTRDYLLDAGLARQQTQIDSLVSVILLRLAQCLAPGEKPGSGTRAATVQRVIEHVDAHLDSSLTLARLARIAGQSQYHLARQFRRATGMSIGEYIIARRIARARDLLITSNARLADIAYCAGFGSQSHMTTLFRRHLGKTPAELRRLESGNR